MVSAQSRRPNLAKTDSACERFSALDKWEGSLRAAAKRRLSLTVRYGSNWSSSWQTYEQIERTTLAEGTASLNVM